MASTGERMKAMRDRRRVQGYRELRLMLPDARSEDVRRRVAEQVASLNPKSEAEAMAWIEAVSEFDTDGAR
jgi:hypothetical protein